MNRFLEITAAIRIPVSELSVRFSRSGGPGGQNVNRRETKVELEFDLHVSTALSEAQRERIAAKLRLDPGETIRVVSQSARSQSENRAIAERRLADILRAALRPVRKRVATKPSRASKERRLERKKRRGATKRLRRGGE